LLEDLSALVEFAHAGSIAGAADRLFRTPSALTRQVQRLEAALGAELLDRSVKPPRLNSLAPKCPPYWRYRLTNLDAHARETPMSATTSAIARVDIVRPGVDAPPATGVRCGAWVSLSIASEVFLEPVVSIRFIIEGLDLDEPCCLVEMPRFRERAVRLQSQDHHSP
jgi:Bacterial regulatory helix-turn-helix protein, lysR family